MKTKYITAIFAALILIATCGTASAWLPDYNYRISISVSNGGTSELTNYQFNFTNNTDVLVAAGHMQASGADCRITDHLDNLIPFWNETPFNAVGTKIWANATTLAVGSNIFYMYYGNAGASSVADGDNTFEMFDDFSDFQMASFSKSTLWSGDPHNAWGMSYVSPNDANKMIYFYRKGPFHDVSADATICRAIYDISANTWSGQGTEIINSTATGIGDRQVSGGNIGSRTYVFNTRYNVTKTGWEDIQVLSTTNDGTNFVLNQTMVPSGNWGWFQVWGHMIQADDDNWIITWYGKNTTNSTNMVNTIISSDGGTTWAFGPTIAKSVTKQYTEADIVNVGNGKLLALFRNDLGDPLTQCTSTDNGTTWSSPQLTNIHDGSGYQHAPNMIYDENRDKICLIYVCFNTDKHYYLEADPDDVFSSPTSYPSGDLIDSGSSYANNPLITKIAANNYYLLWSTGFDSTTVYGGVKQANVANWIIVTGTAPTASNGKLTVDDGWIRTSSDFGTDHACRGRGKMSATDVAQEVGFSNKTAVGGSDDIANDMLSVALYFCSGGFAYIQNYASSGQSQYASDATDTQYHVFELVRNSTTDTHFKIDGSHYTHSPITTNIPTVDGYIHLLDYVNTAGSSEWDWVLVREYAYPEPTTALGAEESPSGGLQLTATANQYLQFNDWETDQTFAQIAALNPNDVCYSWYNHVTGLHEAYYVGRTYNQNEVVPADCSVFGFFSSQTVIDVTERADIDVPAAAWFYGFLPGASSMTLAQIETSMNDDSLGCQAVYRWDGSTNAASGSVEPKEGITCYCTNAGTWTIP